MKWFEFTLEDINSSNVFSMNMPDHKLKFAVWAETEHEARQYLLDSFARWTTIYVPSCYGR